MTTSEWERMDEGWHQIRSEEELCENRGVEAKFEDIKWGAEAKFKGIETIKEDGK